jgi:hypothetical protein
MSYVHHFLSDVHKNEFSVWNNAYLYKETSSEDIDIDSDKYMHQQVSPNMMRGVVKFYA